MKKLIREIHRRSLWQVVGIYLAGAWGALQVVESVTGSAGLPDWAPGLAFVLLVIGLPVVVATAFVQEGLPGRDDGTGDVAGARARDPDTAAAVPDNLAAGTGSLDRPSTRPPLHRRLLTWRNAMLGGGGALALWGLVAAGWLVLGGAGVLGPVRGTGALSSIAVLPFESVQTDEESQAFVIGLHDDLLTQLAKIDSLTVISRTSVLQYAGTTKGIPEIADDLGVTTVLEGAVRRAGDRIRMNVQLIEAETDRHLWAETYDEELTAANVFSIQSDLARRIAAALHARLTPAVERRIEARPTESLAAYDLVARGRYVADSRGTSREGQEAAAGLFREAIAEDSLYAPAYVALAGTYHRLWNLGYLPEEEALPRARAAADRALALDRDLAEAHAMHGALARVERRFVDAESSYRRALELNPGSAEVHRGFSLLLLELGRAEESLAEARRAVQLDPLSTTSRISLLSRLVFARHYDETIEESTRLLEMKPEESDAFYYAAIAWSMKGEHARAIDGFRRARELNPADPYFPAGLAWAYARAGDRVRALETVAEAERAGAPVKEIAMVHAALGDLDAAFEHLDRAFETERASLAGIETDPGADPLHGDPRWDALMRRLRE